MFAARQMFGNATFTGRFTFACSQHLTANSLISDITRTHNARSIVPKSETQIKRTKFVNTI